MSETSPGRNAVVDSGPIIALSILGRLELLQMTFQRVAITPAIRDELTVFPDRPGAGELEDTPWIVVDTPNREVEPLLRHELGAGEVEVIQVARETGATPILDDRKARRIAEIAYGLEPRGTVGLLIEANRHGAIPTIAPELRRLREAGYRLSDRLVALALRAVDEEP
ncbi:MAG: DUF3368 domain-containing protein [Acidobacteriota bacterium]